MLRNYRQTCNFKPANMRTKEFLSALLGLTVLTSCAQTPNNKNMNTKEKTSSPKTDTKNLSVATFGAGCFWCVEAQFQMLEGVEKVESGFAGGTVKNPSYKKACTGSTGHAEVCNIYYDPKKVSFEELLAAFWQAHDPTQLNRQGNDEGTQYRSVIFYHNDEQRKKAEYYKQQMNEK